MNRTLFLLTALLLCLLASGCAGNNAASPEVIALTGEQLTPPDLAPDRRATLEADLAAAQAALAAAPDSEDAHIWYGRRLAYFYRYHDAINAFTRGIKLHPTSYRLLRHRGHRYITIRRFDLAQRDLLRAAKLAEGTADAIEPDGAPNPAGIPRSTDHSNIWYHLALAQYLRSDLVTAERSWDRCVQIRRTNDDMFVAALYWHYLTLRRLGRDADARRALEPVHAGMQILENHSYHALLLMFKGERDPAAVSAAAETGDVDRATAGYGLGIAHLLSGDSAAARARFEVVVHSSSWPAFGHIAAEAELARMRKADSDNPAP